MSNNLLTISMITRESLRILKNELGFTKGVNRQYDDQFAKSGAKIGSTINIRKPVRYEVTDGAAINIQDVVDQNVPLVLDKQKHVAFQFSSKELTLNIDEFSNRYIKPAVSSLANKIDYDGMAEAINIYNGVGTPGTTPTALSTYLAASAIKKNNGCPVDDMNYICMNPNAEASIVNALTGLFHSSSEISKQYEKGLMGMSIGHKWKMDQNVYSHTVGPQGGTPLIDGADQSGSTISTKGWTAAAASRLNKGDTFTIADVYEVNPQNRQSTGRLKQFVVTAAFSSDGSGEGDVSISPSIVASGQYQNVDSLPADEAAITVLGVAAKVSPLNLAYHRDAFVLGMADLELPGGTDMASRAVDEDAGLSIRIVRDYDINTDKFPVRLDVLYGWKTVYPELACRIHG